MIEDASRFPRLGSIGYVNFDPQVGREQRGNRPALIVSRDELNQLGLAFACPITSTDKKWNSHTRLIGTSISGFVMLEQCRSFDWRARGFRHVEFVPDDVLETAVAGLVALFAHRRNGFTIPPATVP